jgi:hypothetical protein
MTPQEKTLENKLRRMLDRRGFTLQKSCVRDPHALTYGGYQIVDQQVGGVVAGWGNANRGFAFDLSDVVAWIKEGDDAEAEAA